MLRPFVARFGWIGLAAAACRTAPPVPPPESARAAEKPAETVRQAAESDERPRHETASDATGAAESAPLGAAAAELDGAAEDGSGLTGERRVDDDVSAWPTELSLAAREPAETPSSAPTAVSIDDTRRAAIRAIEAGEYVHARALIEDLIVGSRLEEGRTLLDRGQTLDALAILEDVRDAAPGREDVLLPFAEASLRSGRELGEPSLVERALATFGQIGDDPAAAFGASRAARALGRTDEALRAARDGVRLLDARGVRTPLEEPAERTWAQAALDAFYLAKTNQSSEADALRTESEDALSRYLGTNSADGWIWLELGKLAESDGRLGDAAVAFERGLHRESTRTELVDGLLRTSFADRGGEGAVAAMTRVLAAHPELALARFDRGLARFEIGVARRDGGAAEELDRARADFAAARAADPTLASAALGWEAICHAAAGWDALAAERPDDARRSFEAMERLFAGGLRWRLEGRVRSGVDGLAFVGAAYQRANRLEDAAALYSRLAEYEPANADFANNAGLFHRDLGVTLEHGAEDLERAARGELSDRARLAEVLASAGIARDAALTPAIARQLAEVAAERRRRALEHFEQSFSAYEKATALAPNDVRVLNDVALILVYYLKRDWERARSWLLRAVELGEAQLADPALTKEQRFELENAFGDAHENLGVLALEHDGDPAAARKWFQRAVEIGPDPRPIITDDWLKRCDELEARR